MNKQIADLILQWHNVFVAIGTCIESARVVLDQSDRGTLLPDRVRELRGELLQVQENIPALADLMEELTGETTWPMKVEDVADETPPSADEEAAAEAAHEARVLGESPPETAPGDYDATGATQGTDEDDAAAMDVPEVVEEEEAAAEEDATSTP